MITSILAVLKAGGAYLPINPDQPESRTAYMLEECSCEVLLSNQADISSAFRSGYEVLSHEDLDKALANGGGYKLGSVSSDDLAYIIYTSGSTGRPKGVMIGHDSLTNFVHYGHNFFEFGEGERILQFSPYYFDVSVEQIWLALTTGSSLVLIDKETLLDDVLFRDYIDGQQVSHLNVTPSYLERVSVLGIPSLKRIVVSGEVCKPSLALKYVDDYDFYNEYGPTEATIISVSHKYSKGSAIGDRIPIGVPINNTQAYVLGIGMELLPKGVVGELYVGGAHLARGYVNREDLTRERFVSNPFGEGLLYRTGDQVRWLPDGTLEYLGRNDDQVKLRGYRIELGEITNRLEELEDVTQALVMAFGEGDSKQLIGYLSGEEVSEEELRRHLSGVLPDYMVPHHYIWLESFPLTSNGKIDRKRLPSIDITAGLSYVGPETESEEQMVSIWSDVLEMDQEKIGVTHDFFELGGHSLKAITLSNRIAREFTVEVPLRALFVHRTVRDMAGYVLTASELSYRAIPVAEVSEYYPLSSTQARMHFLQSFDMDSTCLLYTSPSPRDRTRSRMPSSA